MPTLRSLKRKQRQAKRVLMRRYGYSEKEFFRVGDGSDVSIDAPTNARSRDVSHGFYVRLLPGTWLWGSMVGYYEPGWEEKLPSDILSQLRFEESMDWGAMAKVFAA